MHFETYKDKQDLWRWRLKAGNGRALAHGAKTFRTETQAFAATQVVEKAIRRQPSPPTIVPYKNTAGTWSWFVRDKQLHALADSAETYTRRTNAMRVVNKVCAAIASGPFEVRSAP